MNAVLRSAFTEIVIGTEMEGGFFAGAYAIGDKPYGLIVSAKVVGDLKPSIWIKNYQDVPGARSLVDGLANTQAMAAAGSTLAQKILALEISGKKDWFLGALDENEIAYRNLKPTTDANSSWARSGINLSAIPPTWPYSHSAVPVVQTTVEAFRAGGDEAFEPVGYWTSTRHAGHSIDAWGQYFNYGSQSYWFKSGELRARVFRRFPL